MKLGMTSLTLRNNTVQEVVRFAKEAGLDGIEWGVSEEHMALLHTERAEEIKRLSKENGLEIFSLGSYCRMETREECDKALETAVMLGAPVIRVWAGKKSPRDCDDAYRERIVDNTIYMAERAEAQGIALGFEYHSGTLTETCDEALLLIETVGRSNVGLYWQPDFMLSAEENVRDRNRILAACVGNMHIQNYTPENGYQLLSEAEERLRAYFGDIKNEPFRLMIEFVKDGSVKKMDRHAKALMKILGS